MRHIKILRINLVTFFDIFHTIIFVIIGKEFLRTDFIHLNLRPTVGTEIHILRQLMPAIYTICHDIISLQTFSSSCRSDITLPIARARYHYKCYRN